MWTQDTKQFNKQTQLLLNINCTNQTTYQTEDSNHIKFLVEVYHLGQLYLNLKDQDVQYDVLVSNEPTKKKALTYLFETKHLTYISKIIKSLNNVISA